MSTPLLVFDAVDFSYPARRIGGKPTPTLDVINLSVAAGECVGVIGESGSGKSTLALLAAGLASPTAGNIAIKGQAANDCRRRPPAMRRAVQLVFQDPYGSLDPTFTIEGIVAEGMVIHGLGDAAARRQAVKAALNDVGLGEDYLRRRPHELSGGQRQRVAIARALAVDPDLLILDEPTSALDLLVQAQILNLLLALQEKRDLGFLLITHDLDVVRHLAHRIYVMHRGKIVESGEAQAVLSAPADPYTQRLINAAPTIGATA